MATKGKERVLQTIADMPLFSASAAQLLETTCGPDHVMADIINIVSCDPGLTVAVLRTVNSPAFIRRTEISSIDRAVSQLGEAVVTGIALSQAASQQYNSNLVGYEGQSGDLWRHCLMTGVAAKILTRYSKENIPVGTAFTCGLLHDLGKSVTSEVLKGSATEIIESIDKQEVKEYSWGEEKLIGLDHAEAGYELAKHWKLPKSIPEIIRYHHHPDHAAPKLHPLCHTIHLADILSMMSGTGTGADSMLYSLDQRYLEWFDLEENDLPVVILEIDEEFSELAESITI